MTTFIGTAGDDVLPPPAADNSGNDDFFGLGGNDTLSGGAGDDVLRGGTGADDMVGGTGNDLYLVDNVGDDIVEAAGDGFDQVLSSISFSLTGQFLENLRLLGSGNLDGTGNSLNNQITGNIGDNTLDGRNGDDILEGGNGNDTLIGGGGNDTLIGGLGADSMSGGDGNDTFFVDNVGDTVTDSGTDTFDQLFTTVSFSLAGAAIEQMTLQGSGNINGTGNSLNNQITGNSGNNVLNGGAGDDLLDGGSGADDLVGGTGNDTYLVNSPGDSVSDTGGDPFDQVISKVSFSLVGTGVERLTLNGAGNLNGTGNAFDNSITGTSGVNLLIGGQGDDQLNGGAGADTLNGGAGNDFYSVDNVGDTVIESGVGFDSVSSSVTFSLQGEPLENLSLSGFANINATGNSLSNSLSGNAGNNVLNGGGGQDFLNGNAGADTMNGGLGSDSYVVDNAGDVVQDTGADFDSVQSSVTFSLVGEPLEGLFLTGSANIKGTGNNLDNSITGNDGNNVLTGAAGNDFLNGGVGADTLNGGLGNDFYFVDNAADTIVESGADFDSVQSSVTFSLFGVAVEGLHLVGAEDVDATGNSLANSLSGNTGENLLNGGAGNDGLNGGGGKDRLVGGSGADTFNLFSLGDSGIGSAARDSVQDFDRAEGDKINLSSLDADLITFGNQAFTMIGAAALSGAAGELRDVPNGINRLIEGDVDGDAVADFQLVLVGFNQALIAADFFL